MAAPVSASPHFACCRSDRRCYLVYEFTSAGRNFRQRGHFVAPAAHVSSRSGGRISVQNSNGLSAELRSIALLQIAVTPEIAGIDSYAGWQTTISNDKIRT